MDISNLGHDFAAKDYIESCIAMWEAMGGFELDGLDGDLSINLVCPLERYWRDVSPNRTQTHFTKQLQIKSVTTTGIEQPSPAVSQWTQRLAQQLDVPGGSPDPAKRFPLLLPEYVVQAARHIHRVLL
jgi:hypothetical protein